MRQRLHEMSDRQLLEAYAGGTDVFNDAFGVFVERHQGALLSFAAAFLRDDTMAQDVVQEAFLRVARHPQRLIDAEKAGTERNWMMKVVRDLSVDSIRRQASERRFTEKLATVPVQPIQTPEQGAEVREEAELARAAIDKLKPRSRELLILKVREHKSYKEIAQITGLTVTNVGFLLHQAMKELTEELKLKMNS